MILWLDTEFTATFTATLLLQSSLLFVIAFIYSEWVYGKLVH
jgi:hypothetical protein